MGVADFDLAGALAIWADTEGMALALAAARSAAPRGVTGAFSARMFPTRTTALTSFRLEIHSGADQPMVPWIIHGTKPHMPPVSAVTAWAQSKGLDPWALARSIALHGTRAQPFQKIAMARLEDPIRISLMNAIRATLGGS